MLTKCANPICSAPFLYFHSGKLFRVERRAPVLLRDDGAMADKKSPQSIEYYWLCEGCSAEWTLSRAEEGGIVVKPLVAPIMDVA
jgi:hypothetical protein